MPAAPRPSNEVQRLIALRQCRVLDTEREPAFDDIVNLAASLCDVPVAVVSLVDSERQWFKAIHGLNVSETPRDVAFCAYTILGADPFIVKDALRDERTKDNPLVTGQPGIRFYAGVPLTTQDGLRLGALCLIDFKPRELSNSQLSTLEMLGRQAASQLELRRTIMRLEESQRAVEAATKAKNAFLANMSHEIRTPMTAILGFLELLVDPTTDQTERAELSGTIRRNAEHLLAIINDILDLSKIESGTFSVRSQECYPARKVIEIVHLFAKGLPHQNLEVTARLSSPVPDTIISDPLRLRQILLNLVGNAVKFTEKGTVEIALSCDRESELLCIEVKDTGVGIPEELQKQIFDPFVQADTSASRRYGGTGLGLAISRRLARLLGGNLTCRSSLGGGTTMTLTVCTGPLADRRFLENLPPAEQYELDARVEERRLEGRVLVVDDGADNRRLISRLLGKVGLEVVTAENGQEAVDTIVRDPQKFSLVLMDMQMPGLDGYSAARLLRSRGYSIPIVALTAHAMVEDRQKCLDAGCTDYLPKPVDRRRLIDLCAAWTARKLPADG